MTGQRKPPGGSDSGQIEVTVRTQRLRQRMLTGHVEQIALNGIAHGVQRQIIGGGTERIFQLFRQRIPRQKV